MATVTTNCSVFIAFGLSVLFFGPILFIVVSLMRLLPYIHKQSDAYTEREAGLEFGELRSELGRLSVMGKIIRIHAYYVERQERGDWNEDLDRIGFWSFLIGNDGIYITLVCHGMLAKTALHDSGLDHSTFLVSPPTP
jgi:hypothetical protein